MCYARGMCDSVQNSSASTAHQEARQRLAAAHRVVVKVGSSTITYPNRALDLGNLERLCRSLANQMNQGREMILVTSGAVAVGMNRLRVTERPRSIREKQAEAAIGQAELINVYSRILAEYGLITGQILLTRGDLENARSLANIRNTFEALIEKGVLPIVNENDTVSTNEVAHLASFGDNDTLSALVAACVGADVLVILSDIEGLHDRDPNIVSEVEARLIPYANPADPELVSIAGGTTSAQGTGGMATKLAAARIAANSGIDTVIMHGRRPGDLAAILEGATVGTVFDGQLDVPPHLLPVDEIG